MRRFNAVSETFPLFPVLSVGTGFSTPLGILDVIVGSLANLIVGTFARRSGKVVPTILFGTVFNGIVVGAELSIVYGSPFLLNAVCVAAGEGVSLLLGTVLYKLVGKRVESIWR